MKQDYERIHITPTTAHTIESLQWWTIQRIKIPLYVLAVGEFVVHIGHRPDISNRSLCVCYMESKASRDEYILNYYEIRIPDINLDAL